ncbi:hypothetical protein HYW32_04455 [Candidatus Berkelbacteria bacterium]|nr:hypothetical protein [Candidatus Berkelbacteria bacterium]
MLQFETSEKDLSVTPFLDQLQVEFKKIQQVMATGGYVDDRASLNLLDDQAMLERIAQLAKPYQDAKVVILVGMGGPGLGARAVQEALTGIYHNLNHTPRIFYADTVDSVRLDSILKIAEKTLKDRQKLTVIIATQSGGTTETIAAAATLQALFQSTGIDPAQHMPLITNEDSKLDVWGDEHGFTRILVPPKIGGRYSIFSPVGLFPLAVLGFDIQTLVKGARAVRDQTLTGGIKKSIAALSAVQIAKHYKTGKNIHVTFIFAPELESIGLWCRQIMAESLGKNQLGITPTVAIGSRELHSMFQLYMDGPDDKITTFVKIMRTNGRTVPEENIFSTLVESIENKSFQAITEAIFSGVVRAYTEKKRQYAILSLPQISAETIGSFLQFKMLETMFLGSILGVNPFDQPGVEAYKVETKRILAEK